MSPAGEVPLADAQFRPDPRRQWARAGDAYAAGTAFYRGTRQSAAALAALADQAGRAGRLPELLPNLNGFFALVYAPPAGPVCVAADRARSIPMFYGRRGTQIVVSDNARQVREFVGADKIGREAALDLLMTGFVSGASTLLENVRQVQLGEMIIARPDGGGWKWESRRYFRFNHDYSQEARPTEQFERLAAALESAVDRLIAYAEGRQILLALSGGLDSTMLALALRRRGYDNLAAFSYGSRHSRETLLSRAVAEQLRINWQGVLYTPERWRAWLRTSDRRDYWLRSHHYCSLPHVQDALAVRCLLDEGFASSDAVVVAGQAVESFYGLQFAPDDWSLMERTVVDGPATDGLIYRLHYRLWPGAWLGEDTEPLLRRRIAASLGAAQDYASPAAYLEAWVVQEKLAKFYVNSVRAYEHCGLRWWLPLFDNDIYGFWCQLPFRLRYRRQFTKDFLAWYGRLVCGLEYERLSGHSGLERAARRFRFLLWRGGLPAALYLALKRELKYSHDRMSWHQVVPRSLYRRLFHHRFNINSLLVLELLGVLDLGLDRPMVEDLELPRGLRERLRWLVLGRPAEGDPEGTAKLGR